MHHRHRRSVGLGGRRPAPRAHSAARRLSDAGRRPEHPGAGHASAAGGPAAGLQAVRRAGLRARQQAQSRTLACARA
ncbi:hypothetical protein G6F35_017856 [Rhizopus arrhizus]|nr:hypothetical protein G6F35_017856 [Rhizopus arrhizus]KAG1343899.1 hypothetical protein G6F61_014839 [Rhizopus arrhizus]